MTTGSIIGSSVSGGSTSGSTDGSTASGSTASESTDESTSSGDTTTVESPPGEISDNNCDGYEVELESGSANRIMTSADTDFTTGSNICFKEGTYTFDESMIGFNFGHVKMLKSAIFKHVDQARIDFKAKPMCSMDKSFFELKVIKTMEANPKLLAIY